jgi:tetratricopeptide (TPR) repeat protein
LRLNFPKRKKGCNLSISITQSQITQSPNVIASIVFILLAVLNADAQTPEQLIKQAHWKRAKAAVEAGLAAKPNDATLLYQMSRVKMAYGDLPGAQAFAEKAVAAAPTADHHLQLTQVMGAQAEKASLFKQLSMAGNLKRELAAALAADPKHVQAHYMQMIIFKEAPGIAGGSMSKAHAEAETIARLDPAWGYIAQVDLAAKEKRTADIPELYHKAHDANPAQYETAFQWCNNLAGQKKWPEAEKCARELLAVDSGRTTAYSLLAYIYVNQLRWDDVDKILADAEKAIPDSFTPYFTAGTASTTITAYDRSERYLRKYMTQEPEPNAPKLSRAHWRLGLAFEKAGRKNDAINEIQAATQLEPGFEPAQKDLKRLK